MGDVLFLGVCVEMYEGFPGSGGVLMIGKWQGGFIKVFHEWGEHQVDTLNFVHYTEQKTTILVIILNKILNICSVY